MTHWTSLAGVTLVAASLAVPSPSWAQARSRGGSASPSSSSPSSGDSGSRFGRRGLRWRAVGTAGWWWWFSHDGASAFRLGGSGRRLPFIRRSDIGYSRKLAGWIIRRRASSRFTSEPRPGASADRLRSGLPLSLPGVWPRLLPGLRVRLLPQLRLRLLPAVWLRLQPLVWLRVRLPISV